MTQQCTCARSSARSATGSTSRCAPTPTDARTREGTRGTTLHPARPAHTPKHQLFGQATPGRAPTLEPPPATRRCCAHFGLLLLGAEPAAAPAPIPGAGADHLQSGGLDTKEALNVRRPSHEPVLG